MSLRRSRTGTLAAAVTGLTALSALLGATGAAAAPASSTAQLSHPAVVAHFDLAEGQLPENIVLDAHGSVDVTFAASRQVARVTAGGATTVLATLPAPTDAEGTNTPVMHFPLATGLVRTSDGTLYALYAAGTSKLTGLWKISPGGTPQRVATLPGDGLPNGLALSPDHRDAYATDSVLGVVYRIHLADGAVSVWAQDATLEARGFLGANGIKVHDGGVWVSNLDQGTVVRIPVRAHGKAGSPVVTASGLTGIDDFAFTGHGDTLVAALNQPNTVQVVTPGSGRSASQGSHVTALTAADGLQGPTAIAIDGSTVYVPSAAYNTQQDPDLITAHLAGR